MKGKRALVTGSTSGIGLGIANALAAQGTHLVLNGFGEPAEIDKLRETISGEHGVRVEYDGADLSDPAQIESMMAKALPDGIDILVNNAGIQHVAPIDEFSAERWDAVVAINLSAVFHTMRLAIPAMKERGWGRIINIASAHGLVASANKSAYVATKHAVVGLTKVAALETARTPVTCNAICPGWVLTPLVQAQIEARAKEAGQSAKDASVALLQEKQPSLQFVTTEQIGQMTCFLCSPAADEIRGARMNIDGGWTAR